MGQDKALLCIEGTPLALRTANILRLCGIEQIYLVGRQAELSTLGLPVIRDTHTHHHPLYGVAAALRLLPDSEIMFLPCDLINLATAHIDRLVEFGEPCVASSGGITHPLINVLPHHLAERALHLADVGSSAHQLISDLPVIELPAPSLKDANRPEQLPR